MKQTLIILTILWLTGAAAAQTKQPRAVREFFDLLPAKYFTLESCEPALDKNCAKARKQYLETYLDVEDSANGFMSGGCDGAQNCFTLALFKRPNNAYLVGLNVAGEAQDDYNFLEYRNGKWTDISAQVVPKYSRRNIYELPRNGTTVQVFAKKIVESGDGYEISEKGAKLYDLIWRDGKFTIKN